MAALKTETTGPAWALDVSIALDPAESSYFQSIIDVMRWMVEIGRFEIATEVSLLSSHLAYPQEGNLEAALHVASTTLSIKHNRGCTKERI